MTTIIGAEHAEVIGLAMKQKMGLVLVAVLLSLDALALGMYWYASSAEPPFIPYGAWAVPREPAFPLDKADPDVAVPLRSVDILNAEDFVFTMGVGSGMFGPDVFRVDADGNAFYVFSTGYGGDWWKSEFTVPPPTLAKLRRLLVEVDYASLDRAYHAAVCDGTQWCIQLDVAGATKKVYCNNYFPDAAERLASMISEEILPAHEADIKKAKRIWPSTAHGAAAGLWR